MSSSIWRQIYNVLIILSTPFVFLRLLWRSRKAEDYRKRWDERLGLVNPPNATNGIWIHAVSFGEMNAAIPLIKILQRDFPDAPLTITTTTPTGSSRVKQVFGDQVFHVYLPYDISFIIKRFVNRLQPKLTLLIETELWPNMLHQCQAQGVPVLLVNARLSEKSKQFYQRLAPLTKGMLQSVTKIGAQTAEEAERFKSLGANEKSIAVTGSIKFQMDLPDDLQERGLSLRQTLGADRPVFIAASTHQGEDEIVLDAFAQIKHSVSDAVLLLVPRHPERFDSVAALCAKTFKVARRSQPSAAGNDAAIDIYLGDTMGEMMLFMAASDVAFIGGSFIPVGGHNLLEPAALGVPSLTGPHVFNFADITKQLTDAGATCFVHDANELANKVISLFQNDSERQQMHDQSLWVVKNNQGALDAHVDMIHDLMQSA